MRFLEALACATVVAVLVTLLAWRADLDLVTAPAGAALLTFLAVALRRGAGRTSLRRPAARRRLR